MYSATGPESANRQAGRLVATTPADFDISSSGELTFVRAPDYENPADADMDNTYMVTVMADDGTYMDTHDVTVMVTNVDEDGMVDPVGGRMPHGWKVGDNGYAMPILTMA